MKRFISILVLIVASQSAAQTEADSVNRIVDSLFARASTAVLKYQDEVQPSKEALGEMGIMAVPRLMEKMDTQNARSMHALVDIFKLIGRPAVPRIVDALGEDDPYKRRLAARALGEMKDTTAVEGLLSYADDPDYRIRAGTVRALGKIGDSRGVEPSIVALKDSDYLVRLAAAVSLSLLADPAAVDALLDALTDPYYGVRFKVAEALWRIGDPAVKPVMRSLDNSPDTLSLYLLIEVSGNLRNKKLVKTLSGIIKSDDPVARALAVEALWEIGSKKAKRIIRKLAREEAHPLVLGKIRAEISD